MFARHSILFAALALAGCPRDQDTPPENDTSTSGNDTSGPGTATLTTTTSPTSTTQGTDDTTPADTTASESSTGEVDCLGPMDCWNCDPVEPEQILNRCSSADCEPFENTPERLPLLERDGSLPPIP